ncbi:transcriptional regulator [Paenalkalicoccus suaedae]|uniref:Transcriptional regulator n=1 Tax=Paenalkalicoccus suaedae TaxID=2592382 RepID=A0A859FGF2_9BACI|nr:transcriptional regulator [Paenalkalicoccus suaedae]QKS71672.1 transcriptional regulator [Paenalkalicoccus suaedae]QKS71724.1 transcriptional regulator [Paenalkalicoccus suaedae]
MTKIKAKRSTFRHVEGEWSDYYKTIQEIRDLREEIETPYQEIDTNTGGGRSGFISAPTERTAINLIASRKLQHREKIVAAIEEVYNALPKDHKKLVQVKYWGRENLNWDGVANRCHVSRRQAIVWRNQIIQATIEVLGW